MKQELEQDGWTLIEARTEAKGFIGKYWDLAKLYSKHRNNCDAVLVTFPGSFLVPLLWLLTRFPRKKLIFDAFVSQYDTLVCDRQKIGRLNPYAWLLWIVDFFSVLLPDECICDTQAHATFFSETFFIRPSKFRVVYVGSRDDIFKPVPTPERDHYDVVFYGTYIPLQGIEHILDAAAILEERCPVAKFTLIGSGQTYKEMRAKADQLSLTNVTFGDRLPFDELAVRLAQADLALGIFGTSRKARNVIPHKVFDAIACGVPVLTSRTPAIAEKYKDGNEVILCNAGDPAGMAQKIAECATSL